MPEPNGRFLATYHHLCEAREHVGKAIDSLVAASGHPHPVAVRDLLLDGKVGEHLSDALQDLQSACGLCRG